MNRNLKAALIHRSSDQGFALPVAVGTGLVMLLVGAILISRSQGDQVTASARKGTGGSLATAEGGIARTLAQLTQSNNKTLLDRNYDSINPKTSKTYLGPDGILDNGDEETTAVNQWTSASGSSACTSGTPLPPSMTYSGTIGVGAYTFRAYRYNSATQTGTLLVEGQQGDSASQVAVTVSIDSGVSDFPGVLAVETISLLGRSAVGSNGNVYYDPAFSANSSLTGSSAPGSSTRPQYLNAIHSGSSDSITGDRIDGKIIACKLTPTWPSKPPASASVIRVGDISLTNGGAGTTKNFSSSNTTPSSTITYIRTRKIDLHNNNKIDVNTINGPVYIYVTEDLQLNGNSKIRNISTALGGPKVGDLRIILATSGKSVQTYGSSCIDTAFLYIPGGNIQKGGSGDGCTAAPGSTNIHGVLWAQSISNTSGGYSGVSIPDDVSSLLDLSNSLGLPSSQKLGAVKSWQRLGRPLSLPDETKTTKTTRIMRMTMTKSGLKKSWQRQKL